MMQDLIIWFLLMTTMVTSFAAALYIHSTITGNLATDKRACDFTGFGFYSYLYQLNEGSSAASRRSPATRRRTSPSHSA